MAIMRLGKSDRLQARMKQQARYVAATLLIALARADNASLAGNAVRIRVDPQTTYQIIDGFGASDAWPCQFVGKKWPLEKRERIADLLFSRDTNGQGDPKGIGLSIWRFNVGAGTGEQGDASDIGNP